MDLNSLLYFTKTILMEDCIKLNLDQILIEDDLRKNELGPLNHYLNTIIKQEYIENEKKHLNFLVSSSILSQNWHYFKQISDFFENCVDFVFSMKAGTKNELLLLKNKEDFEKVKTLKSLNSNLFNNIVDDVFYPRIEEDEIESKFNKLKLKYEKSEEGLLPVLANYKINTLNDDFFEIEFQKISFKRLIEKNRDLIYCFKFEFEDIPLIYNIYFYDYSHDVNNNAGPIKVLSSVENIVKINFDEIYDWSNRTNMSDNDNDGRFVFFKIGLSLGRLNGGLSNLFLIERPKVVSERSVYVMGNNDFHQLLFSDGNNRKRLTKLNFPEDEFKNLKDFVVSLDYSLVHYDNNIDISEYHPTEEYDYKNKTNNDNNIETDEQNIENDLNIHTILKDFHKPIKKISVGPDSYAFLLTYDGELYSYGYNINGVLGINLPNTEKTQKFSKIKFDSDEIDHKFCLDFKVCQNFVTALIYSKNSFNFYTWGENQKGLYNPNLKGDHENIDTNSYIPIKYNFPSKLIKIVSANKTNAILCQESFSKNNETYKIQVIYSRRLFKTWLNLNELQNNPLDSYVFNRFSYFYEMGKSVVDVSYGPKHTLFVVRDCWSERIEDNEVYVLGSNKYGQCGIESQMIVKEPIKLSVMSNKCAVKVIADEYHSLVVCEEMMSLNNCSIYLIGKYELGEADKTKKTKELITKLNLSSSINNEKIIKVSLFNESLVIITENQ